MSNRTEWFMHDRFGMFIHWGLYAIPARGEWVRSVEKITVEDYEKYFEEFNPVLFDPKKWARAAKEAGMKYAVLTAKHHDGFCLFDSSLTDYKSTRTKFGRDIVREYLDAFRAEGLKTGLYYSLIDWHHPDYPHFKDRNHPMRDDESFRGAKHDFDKYVAYLHGQVRELCQNYGKLDILWFDFSYDDMQGEKWHATELVNMVRSLQPEVIIDNRLEVSGEGFGSLLSGNPTVYSGDFVSPEQIIPPEGIVDRNGRPVPWEACITMNNHWGYCEFDKEFKSSSLIIRKLVECVIKGGNMLLNVGPDARGCIPDESLEILSEIGLWMKKHSKSIYGAGNACMPKPDTGRFTRKGNKVYMHCMEGTIGPIAIHGIDPSEVKSVRLLSSGAELPVARSWATSNYKGYLFVGLGNDPIFTYALPDPTDTVIEIELKR
jgi:alpha-L-fucosidase